MTAPDSFSIAERSGKFEVTAHVVTVGQDLLILLVGGALHIGAVGMAEPRPSLSDPAKTSATSSVFTFLGHKEDGIAKSTAEELSRRLKRRVVVVAGIHWDGLAPEDIGAVLAMCRTIEEKAVMEVLKR